MPKKIQFNLSKFKVDRESGTLTNLALITANREATGHGIFLDEKTLQTALESVDEKGGRLKAYIAHQSSEDWWNSVDRLLDTLGFFDQVKIEGDKLVAGSFSFFDSFKEQDPAAFARLLEMAEKIPNLFGISIEAFGYTVYIAEDGTEYSAPPEDVELKHGGMPVFRITDLTGAAFVSSPAANEGLAASVKNRLFGGSRKALIAEFQTVLTQLVDQISQNQNTKENTMNTFEALKAKYSSDKAKLQQALSVYASLPTEATIEQVEAEMAKVELEALRAENARLSKEQADATKAAADAQAKKLTAEAKFKAIRESGRAVEIEFGVPSVLAHRLTGYTAMAIDELASSGRFNFAAERTSIADVYTPAIWIPGVREKMSKLPGLWNSPVVRKSPEFDALASGPGIAVDIPYWQDITDLEDGIQVENTAPETKKLEGKKQIAPVLNRVIPFERTALAAQVGALGDPLGDVLQQLAANRAKNRQRVLINILRGLFGTTLSGNSVGTIVEIVGEQTADHMINATKFIQAFGKLGELVSDLNSCVIVAHPTIVAALKEQNENAFIPPSSNGGMFLEFYKGVPIVLNSTLVRAGTTSGFVYDTYVLGTGLVAYGEKGQSSMIGDVASLVVEGDAAKNNVSLYDRTRYLTHLAGVRWKGTPAGQSATNVELATAANWELAFQSADRVPAVRILSNG